MIRRVLRRILGKRQSNATAPMTSGSTPPPAPEPELDMSNIECGAQELFERLDAGEPVVIVDVREIHEIKAHGIIPSAKHIPLRELSTRWEELKDANEIVCYCAAGGRSYNAAMLLRKEGLFNATSMEGGIAAWKAIGGKVDRIES
ncbi:MAG: rhodanese-like domain-containing protein [Myxococcota bacterium]|nr:rhodanese-like domain-containing protein [Myxococcota bacterium]